MRDLIGDLIIIIVFKPALSAINVNDKNWIEEKDGLWRNFYMNFNIEVGLDISLINPLVADFKKFF